MVRESAEERFWTWFATNARRFPSMPDEDDPLLGEMTSHLRAVHSGLTWEIGGDADGAARELTISADGIQEVATAVRRVVTAAPAIAGWKIVAFRQPIGPTIIEMGQLRLDARDIWVRALPEGDRTGLDVAVPGATGNPTEHGPEHAAFILLDAVLGEEAMLIDIGSIEFGPVSADPRAEGYLPLPDLPALLGKTATG